MLGGAEGLLHHPQSLVGEHGLERVEIGIGAQYEDAVELLLLLDLVGVDGEALAADRFEVAAKAGIADERLVALGELALQRGHDRGAIGGVLLRLLMVAANDVAPPRQLDRLGLVINLLAALAQRQRHERRRIIEHQLAHQFVGALAHAQDVEEPPRLQFGHGLGADHAAVGDHAYPRDVEAAPQPVDHRDQRRHVGGVARPHLRADRPPVAVDQHCEDHLPQVRTIVFAVAVPAQGLSAGALEVEAGGVHEHEVEPDQQIAPMREQPLLHYVLQAARRERRAAVLLLFRQLLAQPRHGSIEVMQIERLAAGDGVILAPAVGRAIGAAHEQPMQHREEHRAFQPKAVPAFARQLGDHRATAGLLPQPLEHQRRPDAADRNCHCSFIGRAQHHGLRRKTRARAY